MDQWLAAGNEAADVAAKAAVGRELSCVSEAADAAHDYLVRQRALLQSFWKYLLRLSAEEVRLLREVAQVGAHTEVLPATW